VTSQPSQTSRLLAALVALAGILAGLASLAGIVLRGDLATFPWTTLRGEDVQIVSGGIYAWNSLPVVSEGVGWDIVTLLLAVPGAVLAAVGVARGSFRATLVALGFLVYFLYQYTEYAMFWAVGPLYPLHLLLVAVSLCSIGVLVAGLDLAHAAERFDGRFPRRAVAGLGAFMVVVLCGLWLPTIWKVVVGGEFQGNLNGGVTLVIPALDLGFLVPLGIFTSVAAWRRLPAGYVLATTVVVKAVAMASAIAAMLVVEWLTTGVLAIVPTALFGLTALGSAAIGYRVYGSIADAPRSGLATADSRPAAAAPSGATIA
jgi:hypothetical protein